MIWDIDSTHSRVSFAVRVMSFTTTRGSFKALRGQLDIDEQNPANSWVEAEVEAASIDTRNRLRDAHLRSTAFFGVKKYATISFRSTQVEHVGGQDYRVTGNLTLHGTTRPITFDVHYRGQSSITDGRTGLVAKAVINRRDFGMGEKARFAASSTVAIEIDLEAVPQEVENDQGVHFEIMRDAHIPARLSS